MKYFRRFIQDGLRIVSSENQSRHPNINSLFNYFNYFIIIHNNFMF